MENETVIDAPVDRTTLTERYTEKVIEWIEAHKDGPFFVYLPHATPGSTQTPYVAKRFRGKSKNGLWGDSVEELDWSTGQIMEALGAVGVGGQYDRRLDLRQRCPASQSTARE